MSIFKETFKNFVFNQLKIREAALNQHSNRSLADGGKVPDMIGEDDIVTRSFCGTEQYMSPEMLLQQGHNFRMDWWCLGLLMHEMISAKHPFHGPSHYDTLRNMVTKQPVIDNKLSVHAATVVRSLLIKNPRARLCCRGGAEELKSLPWFNGLDWDELYEKKTSMAYTPSLADLEDVSSFETTFTREEAIDSVASDPSNGSKKKKGGGILGLFGLGGADQEKEPEQDGADAFQDFGFVKDTVECDEGEIGTDTTAGTGIAVDDNIDSKSLSTVISTTTNEEFVPAAPIRKNTVSPTDVIDDRK